MINWGIIGYGRMGKIFHNCFNNHFKDVKLKAIASKTLSTKNFTNSLKYFSEYQDLIEYPEIDAVYISTLNNTHIDLVKKILKTDKKVLCEKPVSLSLKSLVDVKQLIIKKKINFYEAIAYYSHPQTKEVLKLIKEKEIGEIVNIESNFGFKTRFKPDSRLFNKSLGGGSIYDLGCYPLSFFMLFANNLEKISIKSKFLNYAKNGIDDDASIILNY